MCNNLDSKDLGTFQKLLRHNIITFEYYKSDGSIRIAKGTLNPKAIQANSVEKEPDYIKLEKKIVNIVLVEHQYESIEEYAQENNVDLVASPDEEYYYFLPKKKHVNREFPKNLISYFDIEKKALRTFKEENFIGFTHIETVKENENEEAVL